MAAGDFTGKGLLGPKALTTTPADSSVAGAAGVMKTINAIFIDASAAVAIRTVKIYRDAICIYTEVFDPAGAAGLISDALVGLNVSVEEGHSYSFGQDVGADVTVFVDGSEEELA